MSWNPDWNAGWDAGWQGSLAAATAAVSGITNLSEAQVRAGEPTILTLTGDTWVAAGAVFDAVRQAIIDGDTSAQVEALGWNTVVRDVEPVGSVVRVSDTVVQINWSAAPTFDITANEIRTIIIPAAALVGGVAIVATPNMFNVSDPVPNSGLSTVDARYLALRSAFPGGPPTVTDLIGLWLAGEGGVGNTTTDLWRSMLLGKGATPATINDMWFEILTNNGFNQPSLTDKEFAFWAAGGVLA